MPSEAQPVDPLVGVILGGKYRVVRKLGEGGMGAVYEGAQALGTTVRRVAIKTLHPHLSGDPTLAARFQREVGTIAELEHPNTIQVHDFGVTDRGILYIVMEFLQGHGLADALSSEGAFRPERAANVVAQTCGSLGEAHMRGIVHRDLKPDNLFLVERAGLKDFVKVLDFGIAKRAAEVDRNEQKLTQQGMVLGTPPYMSPEQFTGRTIDARSDLYSLGVVAYEMLTGRLPFKADTAWEWASQHMTQPPIPLESFSEGAALPLSMRRAIERALQKAPEARFATAADFADAFIGRAGAAVSVTLSPAAPGTTPFAGIASGPVSGQTPAEGNVAFPTSAMEAELYRPPRTGRGLLVTIAAIIGLASVGAIAFALRGSGASKDVPADPSEPPAPATSLVPAEGLAPSAAIAEPSAGAPQRGGLAHRPPVPGHAPAAPDAGRAETPWEHLADIAADAGAGPGAGTATTTSGATTAAPAAHPDAAAAAVPVLPKPEAEAVSSASAQAKYDGPECDRARTLRAAGRLRQAEALAKQCVAKGGAPPF